VAGTSGEDQVSSAEPKPGDHRELVAVEGVGPRATFARGVEGAARKASVCRRPKSSGGAILTHGPQARNGSLVKGRFDGPKARPEWHGGEFCTCLSEKSRSLNRLSSARFGSPGEASGCNASVGQEACAASAAEEGSPRGPVVLAGRAFLREPSLPGSAGIHRCRAGEGTEGHPDLRALPSWRCQKRAGSGGIFGRSVQIGTLTIHKFVWSAKQHEPIPRQVHPHPPLNRTGTLPTTCGCAAGTGAQRPARSDTSRLFGGPSRKKVSVAGRKRARIEAGIPLKFRRVSRSPRCAPKVAPPVFVGRWSRRRWWVVQRETRGGVAPGRKGSGELIATRSVGARLTGRRPVSKVATAARPTGRRPVFDVSRDDLLDDREAISR
jgi:hypothetical protein